MKQKTIEVLNDGLVTSTVGLGIGTSSLSWIGYLTANAPGIGIILTSISLIIYVVFQCLAHRKLALADKNVVRIEKQDKKLEYLERQLQGLSDRKSLEQNKGN